MSTTPFNPADYMESEEDVLAYIEALAEAHEPATILSRLRQIADSEGMTALAKATGLNRQGLYRALSNEGDPKLSTLHAILDALGLQMSVTPKKQVA